MSQQDALPLHRHRPRPHQHQNANAVHASEQAQSHPIDKAITWVCDQTASVVGIILFSAIGTGAFIGYVTQNVLLGTACGAFSSSFLQLVYLALLLRVGKQSDRARQIQSDEMYKFCENTFHDTEQQMLHMNAQDTELVQQSAEIQGIQQQIAELRSVVIDRDDAIAALIAHMTSLLDDLEVRTRKPQNLFARIRQK